MNRERKCTKIEKENALNKSEKKETQNKKNNLIKDRQIKNQPAPIV